MSDTWLSYVCHLKGEHSKTVWSLYHHCVTFREPPKSSVTLNGGVVGSKGCLFILMYQLYQLYGSKYKLQKQMFVNSHNCKIHLVPVGSDSRTANTIDTVFSLKSIFHGYRVPPPATRSESRP
jgi:hypothetical protein